MNTEDAFQEESQQEILDRESRVSQRRSTKYRARVSEEEAQDESRPLIQDADHSRGPGGISHKRGYSYQRAINEPWTGAYGQGDRPWYKKPSVGRMVHV